jgi:hypothetical protein
MTESNYLAVHDEAIIDGVAALLTPHKYMDLYVKGAFRASCPVSDTPLITQCAARVSLDSVSDASDLANFS